MSTLFNLCCHAFTTKPVISDGSFKNLPVDLCHLLLSYLKKSHRLNDETFTPFLLKPISILNLSDTSLSEESYLSLKKLSNTLENLNISKCLKINDNLVQEIYLNCTNLKVLNISNNTGVTENVFSKPGVFTNLEILQFDAVRPKRFEPKCSYTISTVSDITARFPNLKVLSLKYWTPSLTNECLKLIGNAYPHLETLDLENCRKIEDDGIRDVMVNPLEMESINLSGCLKLTNEALNVLANCSNLHTLTLESSSKIDDKGIETLLQKCNKLKVLTLAYLDNITDKAMESLAQCASLQAINLVSLKGVTLNGIKHIPNDKRKHLIKFRLDSLNADFDNEFITKLASHSKNLQELYLEDCVGTSDDGISVLCEKCPRLRVLFLNACPKFTDRSLFALAANCKNLEELVVGRIRKNVTDAGLIELAQNCPNLRLLDVLHDGEYAKVFLYRAVTNAATIALAKNCPKLEILCLRFFNITDEGLSLFRSLVDLNVKGCVNLTKEGINKTLNNCPNLKYLTVEGCSQFEKKDFEHLKTQSINVYM